MGKTLAGWIDAAQPTLFTNSNGQTAQYLSLHNQKELQGALRAMGSNAVPALIAILDHADSVLTDAKLKILRTPQLPQTLKAKFSGDMYDTHQELSFVTEALRFLGTDAVHAIPDLERIICDPNRTIAPMFATTALGNLGFVATPALQRCLTNAPTALRGLVQRTITQLYQSDLKSVNREARTAAALALADTPRPPFEIIVPLVELLDSPLPVTRRRALNCLAQHLPTLAPSLVVAYRAVEKQTTSDDPAMRRVATDLLARLSPPPPEKKP